MWWIVSVHLVAIISRFVRLQLLDALPAYCFGCVVKAWMWAGKRAVLRWGTLIKFRADGAVPSFAFASKINGNGLNSV
jgi:hypothetical protein